MKKSVYLRINDIDDIEATLKAVNDLLRVIIIHYADTSRKTLITFIGCLSVYFTDILVFLDIQPEDIDNQIDDKNNEDKDNG
jgi:hypothetical protein